MTRRIYGASEEIVLRQLERNLAAASVAKAPWRVRAALCAGAAVVLETLEAAS